MPSMNAGRSHSVGELLRMSPSLYILINSASRPYAAGRTLHL
jgi:hypothetical protein